jgi:hypothetical protein
MIIHTQAVASTITLLVVVIAVITMLVMVFTKRAIVTREGFIKRIHLGFFARKIVSGDD